MNKDSIKVSVFVIETQEVITGYHNYHVFFFLRKDIDSLIIGNIYEAKISQDRVKGYSPVFPDGFVTWIPLHDWMRHWPHLLSLIFIQEYCHLNH